MTFPVAVGSGGCHVKIFPSPPSCFSCLLEALLITQTPYRKFDDVIALLADEQPSLVR